MYIHILLLSLCMLVTRMSSGLTTWHPHPAGAFHWRSKFLHLSSDSCLFFVCSWELLGFLLSTLDMSAVVFVQPLVRCSSVLGLLGDTSHSKLPGPLLLPLFHNVPSLSCCRVCLVFLYIYTYHIETGFHNAAFWSVVTFCNVFHLLQRKVSLMRGEDHTYLWYEDRYLECS